MPKWTGKWLGGQTYQTSDGRTRWAIRKMIAGRSYEFTLDVDSEADALLEYRAFKADPEGYRTPAEQLEEARANAVHLDSESVAGFLQHLREGERSSGYRATVKGYLASWCEALDGRDLRALDGKTTKRVLDRWNTGQKHRIIAFKSFCSWLVEKGCLDPNEDPGRFLTVPASKRTHERKGYTIEAVEAMYSALPSQAVRDVLCIQAKTGMHHSEVGRLAAGKGTIRVVEGYGRIAATLNFTHKNGRPKILSVDEQALRAAQRLQGRGRAPTINTIREAVLLARSKNPALQDIQFGALRHSFATWLAECGEVYQPKGKGVPLDAIAEALGHTNARTTSLHYLSVQVPAMYLVPIRLAHPSDQTGSLRIASASPDGREVLAGTAAE